VIAVAFASPPGFAPACTAVPEGWPAEARWVIQHRGELVVGDGGLPRDPRALGLAVDDLHGLGAVAGEPAFGGVLRAEAELPAGLRTESLRGAFALLPAAEQAMAAYGFQVLHWSRTTRFCGECGLRTEPSADPTRRARRCPGCGHEWFPRVSPCVITLVHDGDRVLMTRQAAWPAGRYGLVAGFVEPGESLEDCVRREALEETGVSLADLAYAGSQPWPFPHQLMVGFTARWAGGEAGPRDGELEDARWFTRDALPILPPRFSIARRLIDAWVARPSEP
jgi:NAD+ diphosphatase